MKKIKLSPLKLDPQTIAKLDRDQLAQIKGGFEDAVTESEVDSCSGRNSCRRGSSCSKAQVI